MARTLTGLKVKIGLRPDGHADHPDFNKLAVIQSSGIDWSYWVDMHGDGWKYDNCCGHKEDDAVSPFGMQWGLLIVPEDFADEAVTMFPPLCERMTELECQTFYDERHAVRIPSLKLNQEVLTALAGERVRLVKASADTAAIDAEIIKAEDPDDPASGVRRVQEKTWAGLKGKTDFTYREPALDRSRIPPVR